jgi:hypothetical protein
LRIAFYKIRILRGGKAFNEKMKSGERSLGNSTSDVPGVLPKAALLQILSEARVKLSPTVGKLKSKQRKSNS